MLYKTHSESDIVKFVIPNSFKFSYTCCIATAPALEFPNSSFCITSGSRGTIPSSLLPCLSLFTESTTVLAKHLPSCGSDFRHFWISGAINFNYFKNWTQLFQYLRRLLAETQTRTSDISTINISTELCQELR